MSEDRMPEQARTIFVEGDSDEAETFSESEFTTRFVDSGATVGMFDWFEDVYAFKTYTDRFLVPDAFLGVGDQTTNPFTCYFMPFNCPAEVETDLAKFRRVDDSLITFDATSCHALPKEPRLIIPGVVF